MDNSIKGATFTDSNGNDVVFDFEEKNLLKIDYNFTASYDKSAKAVTFSIGVITAVTLKDFGNTTTSHVNSDTYKISGSNITKK